MDNAVRGSFATGLEAFAWLIDPLAASDFRRDFYERHLCLVARADPGYYLDLLGVRDLDLVLGTHNVIHPEISLVRGEDEIPKSLYTCGSSRIDPLLVAKQFDEGATIIFNQLQHRVPVLAEFCASLGQFFGSRLQTNVYLTPPNAQGFQPHWDTHDVFVLQVLGRKLWSAYDAGMTLPLKGQKFDSGRNSPGRITKQFELGAGDAVYIPRGVMHSARSSEEASLHITLGLTAFTWTDFLLQSVAATALQDESLRRALPLGLADRGVSEEHGARLVRDRLATLGACIPSREVWRHFVRELLAVNNPLFTDLLNVRLCGDAIALTSSVTRRRGVLLEFEDRALDCALYFCGQELKFPKRLLPAVKCIAESRTFAVHEIPDCLDSEDKIVFVSRLVRDGLLRRLDEEESG